MQSHLHGAAGMTCKCGCKTLSQGSLSWACTHYHTAPGHVHMWQECKSHFDDKNAGSQRQGGNNIPAVDILGTTTCMRPSERGQLRDTRRRHRPRGLRAASSVHTASQARVSTRHECQFSKHGEIQVPNWPRHFSASNSRKQGPTAQPVHAGELAPEYRKSADIGDKETRSTVTRETWSHWTLFLPVSNSLFSIPQGHNSAITGPCHRASSFAFQLVFLFYI